MKRVTSIVFLVLACVVVFQSGTARGSTADKIEGQWELVSGGDMPAGWKEIKLISNGHFIWVIYDGQKKDTGYTGGGTYKIDGNQCIEHLEFMTVPGANAMIGKEQPLTMKLEGNNLVLTGTLSNGSELNETWKRVE